ALVFTDARLLCLPIRSFYGTFAWVSSPFCLERFKRDMGLDLPIPKPQKNGASVTKTCLLHAKDDAKVYLEDLDLAAAPDEDAGALAAAIAAQIFADDPDWQEAFKERFTVVDDDVFTFLCEAGTEVTPHIRVREDTGVVARGALWYEETLPVETILTGQVWCDKVYAVKDVSQTDLFERYCHGVLPLQMGGKASTGKGQVRCIFEPVTAKDR
ncbi:MAG: type III-B CRISPR module RAMP protein Cmr4, partial [Desulfovibrio sp.]|nr:type III-B CRISPR module RAMP protein Cmr4 [Desulfovibrio sp.]